jgi:hypothetical protein
MATQPGSVICLISAPTRAYLTDLAFSVRALHPLPPPQLAHAFAALLQPLRPILIPGITYNFYKSYCTLFDLQRIQLPLTEDFAMAMDDVRHREEVRAAMGPLPPA